MKIKIYSVYDAVAKVWNQPFYQMNDQVAQRTIANCVNTQGHNYNMNPEDFSLYFIGEFNDQDGIITPVKEKKIDLKTLQRSPIAPAAND
jgi:hypothetical protein